MEEAFHIVSEFAIQVEELVEFHVQNLAKRLCDARAEMARILLELNLRIAKLLLKAQPSTLHEVREQLTTAVTIVMVVVESVVTDCMELFKQSFEVLTIVQEDPNIKRLEIDACELK